MTAQFSILEPLTMKLFLSLILIAVFARAQDSVTVSLALNATGVLQTGQTSRVITNSLAEFSIENKSTDIDAQLLYTYGMLGKSGNFPNKVLENDFLATITSRHLTQWPVYPVVMPMFETSNLREITTRYAISAGIGRKIISHKTFSVETITGIGYEETDYVISGNAYGARGIVRVQGFYAIPQSGVSLSLILAYQPSLIRDNDTRLRGLAKLQLKVVEGLSFSTMLSFISEDYRDRAREKDNLQLTFGFGFKIF